MRPLAARTRRIATSPTMKVTATVDRLRRAGVEVIDFGAGEPDFSTPREIGDAGRAAVDRDFTKYTPVAGIADLRRAICARYRADYGVEYSEAEVIVTAGGKQALFNTALALFGPGDEVITHAPYWPTLAEQVKLAAAAPVVVRTREVDGFAIRAAALLDAVTPSTRGIIVNSPCNPTGALIGEADLIEVACVAARRGIWLVIDLCYEKLIYDPVPHNIPAVLATHCPDLGVICGSASKAYAMTGWRGGWSIAPREVIAAQAAIQSHATSNASSVTQQAMLAALTGPPWTRCGASTGTAAIASARGFRPMRGCDLGGPSERSTCSWTSAPCSRPANRPPCSRNGCSRNNAWPSRPARGSMLQGSSGSRLPPRWRSWRRGAGDCSSSRPCDRTRRRDPDEPAMSRHG
jgi:aspartate aminotransferase